MYPNISYDEMKEVVNLVSSITEYLAVVASGKENKQPLMPWESFVLALSLPEKFAFTPRAFTSQE